MLAIKTVRRRLLDGPDMDKNKSEKVASDKKSGGSTGTSRPRTGQSTLSRWAWLLLIIAALAGAYVASVAERLDQTRAHNLRTLEQTATAVERLVDNAKATVKSLEKENYACEFFKRQPRLSLVEPPKCSDLAPIDRDTIKLAVAAGTGTPQLRASIPNPKDTTDGIFIVDIMLDRVLDDAPFGDTFDFVVIADDLGKVIQQHRPTQTSAYQPPDKGIQQSLLGLQIEDLNKLYLRDRSEDKKDTYLSPEGATTVNEVNLAGASYTLMCQPLILGINPEQTEHNTSENGDTKSSAQKNWRLCGVVGSDRSFRQALEVASPLVIAMFSVALIGVLAWPIFKILTVARRERLRFLDLYSVLISTVAIIMVTTVLLLNLDNSIALRDRSESRLEHLGTHLEEDLMGEFRRMHEQLVVYDEQLSSEDVQEKIKEPLENAKTGDDLPRLEARRLLLLPTARFTLENSSTDDWSSEQKNLQLSVPERYPYLTSAFWMRPCDGKQLVKATVRTSNTPAVTLSHRPYFDAVSKNRLWPVGKRKFYVQTFASITTGEFSAALSTESGRVSWEKDKLVDWSSSKLPVWTPGELEDLSHDCAGDINTELAAAISARPYSVMHPILAPGVGFAIVDATGKAVFHSDVRRATLENLLDDDGLSRRLRAALASGASTHFDADYRTASHQVYVTPIKDLPWDAEGLPWSIVTFADDEIMRTSSLEVLSRSTILVSLYLLLLVGLTVIYIGLRRRDVPKWLWPLSDRSEDINETLYRDISRLFAAVILVFVLVLRGAPPDLLLLASVIIPLLTVLTIVAGFSLYDKDLVHPNSVNIAMRVFVAVAATAMIAWYSADAHLSAGRFEAITVLMLALFFGATTESFAYWWRRPLRAYMLVSVLLWTIVAVLPAYSFFKIAHGNEMSIVAQLERDFLERVTSDRARQIEDYYRDIKVAGRSAFLGDLLGDCGIYDAMLSNTSGETADAGANQSQSHFLRRLWEYVSRYQPVYNETTSYARYRALQRVIGEEQASQKIVFSAPKNPVCSTARKSFDFAPPIATPKIGMVVLVFGPLLYLLLWAWVVYGARRLFFGKIDTNTLLTLTVDDILKCNIQRNTVTVVSSDIQYKQLTDCLSSPHVIDLSDENSWPSINAVKSVEFLLCLRLERILDDAVRRAATLAYLEQFTTSTDANIIVAVSAHPEIRRALGDCSEDEDADENKAKLTDLIGDEAEVRRWQRLLETFVVRHVSIAGRSDARISRKHALWKAPDADWVRSEISAVDGLEEYLGPGLTQTLATRSSRHSSLDAIVTHASEYFDAIWNGCSADEQLVLIQLEYEGVINPKQAAIVRRLLRRGLLRIDPTLRLVNNSFGLFVSRAVDAAQVREWERFEGPQWAKKRSFLLGAIFLILIFLWFTQRDVVETWIAYVGALAMALSGVFKIMSNLRGGTPGAN